jgi:hypothetical protein
MSDYSVIAYIGQTIVELLRDKMHDLIPREQSIVLASPGEIEENDDVRLSLFLYQVLENVDLKNQQMQIKDYETLTFPPIALDLYYMLTSYKSSSQSDLTDKTIEEHKILGKAIQILNDNSTLTGLVLRGGLEQNKEFHMTITPMSLDDLSKIWTTFQGKPFRSSICYLVTPVMIDSGREIAVHRVVSKETHYTHIVPEERGK